MRIISRTEGHNSPDYKLFAKISLNTVGAISTMFPQTFTFSYTPTFPVYEEMPFPTGCMISKVLQLVSLPPMSLPPSPAVPTLIFFTLLPWDCPIYGPYIRIWFSNIHLSVH